MRPRVPWPFGRLVGAARRVRRILGTRLLASTLLVVLVAVALVSWVYSMRWGFRHDGPVVIYPAHLMRTGQRILYRDIFDMNQPATFLAMGIVDAIAGTNDRALRAIDVLVLAVTCALTPAAFRMPRRLPGWAASAVYAVFHLRDAGADALQREVWVLLFVVASGAALRRRLPVLAGVLAGLAFFVKFHAIAFALILLAGHLDPPTRWRTMAKWSLGVLATSAFLVGGLACFGAADDWWWIVHNYLPLYAQLSGALGFEPDPMLAWQERVRCVLLPGTAQTLWVFPFAAWLLVSVDRRSEWARPAVMASCFFFAAWLYPIPAGTFWTYQMTPAFFGAGVVLAVLIGARMGAMRGSRLERVAMVCLALYVTNEEMRPWVEDAQRNATASGLNRVAPEVEGYLVANLPPGETVQPLDTVFGVVDGMWRADAPLATSFAYQFMFFHNVDSDTTRTLRLRLLRELEEARPAIVIQARGLPWVAGGIAASPDFFELDRFLEEHYEVDRTTSMLVYMRRRDPWRSR